MELQKIGETPEIGFNKYKFLKSLELDDLTEIEINQISEYESRNTVTEEQLAMRKRYVEKAYFEPELKEIVLDKKWFWNQFLINYKILNSKDFIQNPETIDNIKAVMYYFLKDENFFLCSNLNVLSRPSFDKGLLIVGSFGNGKTSIMLAIEKTLRGLKGFHFRSFNANEVVKMFESIKNDNYAIDLSRKDFDNKMTRGDVYFDDLKTERDASNFGKVNLFKEILEMRSQKNNKTYVTMNYKQGFDNDIEKAIDEIAERYGDRVYDRVYQMFNIIEFKGKSQRL